MSQSTSVLYYGPEGCGKSIFAEALFHEFNESLLFGQTNSAILLEDSDNIVKVIKKNVFQTIDETGLGGLLIDDVDVLLPRLRAYPVAHGYLLDRLKSRTGGLVIVTTARHPESLSDEELAAFEMITPLLYPDSDDRIDILQKIVQFQIVQPARLESTISLEKIAGLTEWWSGRELKELIDISIKQGFLSEESLLKNIKIIGDRVIPEHRIKRMQELVRFTDKYCTDDDIRLDILYRFS